MEYKTLYDNLFSIFLVESQGDIYVKDYGKFLLKKYLSKFPENPKDFNNIISSNYEDIRLKVEGLIDDKILRNYDYFNFFEGGELNEEEKRDFEKILKNTKKVSKFSVQLYSQELNWVSGKYYKNLMKEIDTSRKIKHECEKSIIRNKRETQEAIEIKKDCYVKIEEMTTKTKSMERALEKLTDEGKSVPECCICVNVQDLLVFAPCGHQVVCENCVKKMRKMECPMCRTQIRSYCKIFT